MKPHHKRINSPIPSGNFSKGLLYLGLGYDSTSDDYNILKIDNKSCSEILALKSGSWRIMDKHPIDVQPRLTSTDCLVFVHGAFHWLISSLKKYYVMSFSISNEVYREILLPEQLYSNFSKLWG
uniref:F-box associated beta-propeller type 1 domain-containing protein n=1 Tax=Solanum tuberosum TaxID=4113 RepID=M1DQU0_SOLTU